MFVTFKNKFNILDILLILIVYFSDIAIRSGDYYMFEDVEDEFELDLFNQKEAEDEEDKKSSTRRRLSKKMTFGQVSI